MSYYQEELDLRMDPEKDLDSNIDMVVRFAHGLLMEAQGGNYVKNRHEGYGLLAEQHVYITDDAKLVKDDMTKYLKVLQIDDYKAVDAVASIERSLHKLIVATVCMAAQAKRISEELFAMVSEQKTPMEEYIDSHENDGFEAAEDTVEPEEAESEEENGDEE